MFIQRILRDTTLEQRKAQEEKPIVHPHRKRIPVEETPTRLQLPHDCSHRRDTAVDKSQRKIFNDFIRFAAAALWECRIERVATDLQSGQSHCGKCECAHYASNIRDNKMIRVLNDVSNNGELTPNKQMYLDTRLSLETPDKKQLKKLKSGQEKVEFLRGFISPGSMRNSFNKTAYQKQLASTIEGPIEANDLDQAIENDFRPIEDDLSDQVTAKKIHYKEATAIAFQKLTEILNEAISNLNTRVKQLTRFKEIEQTMDQIEKKAELSDEDLKTYIKCVGKLIKLRTQILTKLKYSVNLQQGRAQDFTHREDFFWLKSFKNTVNEMEDLADQKIAFQLHKKKIKKEPATDECIALKKARIRLLEAEGQLQGLMDIGECNLDKLDQWLFGINEKGKRRAPTEPELLTQLIAMTKKEAPQKKTKKVAISMSAPQKASLESSSSSELTSEETTSESSSTSSSSADLSSETSTEDSSTTSSDTSTEDSSITSSDTSTEDSSITSSDTSTEDSSSNYTESSTEDASSSFSD